MSRIGLVTGAGSGIGAAVSRGLVENGWTIVVAGRREAPLASLTASAPEGSTVPMTVDVTDETSVRDLFDQIKARFGRLDLLFNNAGVFPPSSSIEDMTLEAWREAIDVNLTGAFLCTKHAFRLMKSQLPIGGRIINNGSISAQTPRPAAAHYTATKHGLTGLTKATSLDGRRYAIACGQIDIGNAATDMTAKMTRGVLQADGRVAPEPTMPVDNVVKAVVMMADLPLDANVQFMTVLATMMPFGGRG
jgi:NAD(P)-dependent dehydrogenase (short-subunit alcohol dehydrogenase family)